MSLVTYAPSAPVTAAREPSPRQWRRQDHKAVAALRARRPDAMALVMEAHGRTVLGYLTQLLGDRTTAEDVLQVVLLEVWQRASTYDPDRSGLLTWVLTIARSRAIDELRRRVPEPLDPVELTAWADGAATGDSETERMLEEWRIAGLLARLPREESSLLRLRFYDGLSQSEISERTGIALGTVKARMVNGLSQLRELLEAEEGVRAGS